MTTRCFSLALQDFVRWRLFSLLVSFHQTWQRRRWGCLHCPWMGNLFRPLLESTVELGPKGGVRGEMAWEGWGGGVCLFYLVLQVILSGSIGSEKRIFEVDVCLMSSLRTPLFLFIKPTHSKRLRFQRKNKTLARARYVMVASTSKNGRHHAEWRRFRKKHVWPIEVPGHMRDFSK